MRRVGRRVLPLEGRRLLARLLSTGPRAVVLAVGRQILAPGVGRLRHHRPRPIRVPGRYGVTPPLRSYPLISIVTPTLNSAPFLERTVRSVLEQGYGRLEHIVQDGGSTDGTHEILDRYRTRLATIESARDSGLGQALNRGFRRGTGEILAYLNSDDLLLPGALHYAAGFFLDHPEVDVLYGHRVLIDEEDREIGRWVLPPHDERALQWADYVPQETLFWRRRVWEEVGASFDESYRFAVDWDFLLRLRRLGARFARVPRFLGAFRVHPAQKSAVELRTVGDSEMARLREREHGRPVSPDEIRR